MHFEELGLQMEIMIPRIIPPQRVVVLEEGKGDNLLDLNASHQQFQANENAMEE